MSHKLQIRALLGLVVVITIMVGVLVWPAPKEARANENYTVYVYEMENLIEVPVVVADMILARFDLNGDEDFLDLGEGWLEPSVQGNGVYVFVLDNAAIGDWEIQNTEDDEAWPGVNPVDEIVHLDPTVIYFEWEVEEG